MFRRNIEQERSQGAILSHFIFKDKFVAKLTTYFFSRLITIETSYRCRQYKFFRSTSISMSRLTLSNALEKPIRHRWTSLFHIVVLGPASRRLLLLCSLHCGNRIVIHFAFVIYSVVNNFGGHFGYLINKTGKPRPIWIVLRDENLVCIYILEELQT